MVHTEFIYKYISLNMKTLCRNQENDKIWSVRGKMMETEIGRWLTLSNKFAREGDFRGMRACAQEVLDRSPEDADGLAVMAEASLYMQEEAQARELLAHIQDGNALRVQLLQAELHAVNFELHEELTILRGLLRQAEILPPPEPGSYDSWTLERAQCLLADACALAAQPEQAAQAVFAASRLEPELYRRAGLYSKGLFFTNYVSMAQEHRKNLHTTYNDFFLKTKPLHGAGSVPSRSEAGGRLRIGYVSPDFRQHAAAYFFAPLLRDYDREAFQVYVYSTGRRDRVTAAFRRFPVKWRDMAGASAEAVAKRIRAEGIDILVDLSGHTQDSCLPVLAYRPAPVQVSGIGYVNTTGLAAVDYFLSDVHCMPPREIAGGFTEQVLRLPHSHLCYAPEPLREMPEVCRELPCDRNGFVTFGCFNNFTKVTEDVLLLWRAILEHVPGSRLVLKAKLCSLPDGQKIIRERLKALSIDAGQVELRPFSPDYLEQYGDIDLALDTMPYTGGLTTCEALYMGVPVVSLRGRSHGARFGASFLENAGLSELLAESEMDYVARAARLALLPDRLRELRTGLRERMRASFLMDGPAYMREFEAAYTQIWLRHCENELSVER